MPEPPIATHQEMVDELDLIILGRRDWLDRARQAKIRRQPALIERAARRLEIVEEVAKRLKAAEWGAPPR